MWGRLGQRLLGVGTILGGLLFAVLAYVGLWLTLRDPPSLLAVGLALALTTLLVGYASYRAGPRRLSAAVDARPLPAVTAPDLHRRVDQLAARMDVVRPALYVADLRTPNALALDGRRPAVLVDRSLLSVLPPDELAAIVAHELAHLEGRDGLRRALLTGGGNVLLAVLAMPLVPAVLALSGLVSGLEHLHGRPARRSRALLRALGGGLVGLALVLTAFLRRRTRRQEFLADARAAAVTGDPDALARALHRIDRVRDRWQFAAVSPHTDAAAPLERLLATHPPVDERIARLRNTPERR